MFEEQGWEGDLLYPARGDTCTLDESLNISPKKTKNPENTIHPYDTSCSLHELLRSPIEGEISCNSSSLTTLTKQAVLCEGQSALDVALQHPDLEGLGPQDLCGGCQGKLRRNGGDGAPPAMQLEVVREPSAKVTLEETDTFSNNLTFPGGSCFGDLVDDGGGRELALDPQSCSPLSSLPVARQLRPRPHHLLWQEGHPRAASHTGDRHTCDSHDLILF